MKTVWTKVCVRDGAFSLSLSLWEGGRPSMGWDGNGMVDGLGSDHNDGQHGRSQQLHCR